ncbi:MAG: porin, partial [Aeromonas sp.]
RQEGQVIYMNRWGGLFANLSYQTNDDKNELGALESGFAGSIGYDFANGFGIAAGGERKSFDGNANKNDWAVAASYAAGPYYFAGMFNESTLEAANGSDTTIQGYELFANYSVDAWTFELGYNKAEDDDNDNLVELTYVGAQYKLNSKVKAWTEYAISGTDQDDKWTLGLQYNF